MDAAERELFTDALTQAVASATAAAGAGGAALDDAMAAVGWADALDADRRTAVSALFELQGAAAATSSALATLVARSCDVDAPGAAVLLPPLGTAEPPGLLDDACVPVPEVRIAGVGLRGAADRERVVVVAARDAGSAWAELDGAQLAWRDVGGLDPVLGLSVVDDTAVSTSGPWNDLGARWPEVVAAARLAVGHELVGTMRTMLALAREHALDRIQFGAPIATFQAVRHRLAEALVAIEAAEAALDGAWVDGSPFTATVAKAVAGTSARTVRKHCQQVLAGIGFTTEHDLHRFVRRSMVLDALFGDARALNAELGAELLAARRLPDILPL